MAAFLNHLADNINSISFLVGIIFMITSLILLRFPPKKINYLYGYRTPSSMKNQQAWDFSQKFSAVKMFQVGLVLLATSFLNILVDMSQEQSLFLGLGLLILGGIYMFVVTEKAIKRNFPNE